MIDEAFLHFEGIGPVRLAKLKEAGIQCWYDAVAEPEKLPPSLRDALLRSVRQNIDELERRNIRFFVDRLIGPDRWRILSEFLEQISYFDIETFGLEYDAPITTIVVWHKGRLHTFVEHENLDDFLELVQDVSVLASFNGSSFDVPRVLDTFHIPSLPCPHLDLRWLCYHRGWRGGLKDIATRSGIERPTDLDTADGELAVRLWARWIHFQDRSARDFLIRYCAADVILLVLLAKQLADRHDFCTDSIWSHLPDAPQVQSTRNHRNELLRLRLSGPK